MIETAIPVQHSFIEAENFVNPPKGSADQDLAISELSEQPGWIILEKQIESEINRLEETRKFDNESVQEYGFRRMASEMVVDHLKWVLNHVRSTARTVIERKSGD
jgi:hypothetical protein